MKEAKNVSFTITQGEILTLLEALNFSAGTLKGACRILRDLDKSEIDIGKLRDVLSSCEARVDSASHKLLEKLLSQSPEVIDNQNENQ